MTAKVKKAINDWTLVWKNKCFECKAPATMYSVLLENGVIEDPYVGLNARKAEKLAEDDCRFQTVISVDESLIKSENIFLCFDGLDTLCDIYLNGKCIEKADNMHRTWRISVKKHIHVGDNTLMLYFHSPIKAMEHAQKRHELIGNSDTVDGFSHLRKAYFMSGWDWCPALSDMGVWKDAYLLCYDGAIIESVLIRQNHRDNGGVDVSVTPELCGICDNVHSVVTITSPDGEIKQAVCSDGSVSFEITNPMLWWPNGYGEQPLYSLTVELYCGDTLIDTDTRKIGLRTITVNTERDESGRNFCFSVNGMNIFAMGANYIPEDNLLTRYSKERTEHLIKSCAEANYNMLRVWGGGIYPSDYFFELCDEYGIIVWQDYMFACATLWLTESFKRNVIKEIIENTKRIRHHACLGLLCGNNEMEFAHEKWQRYSKNLSTRTDYLELFEHIIPEICDTYAPDIFYWPSSPSSGGGYENICEESFGDTHFWSVWLGLVPIEEYKNHKFRFLSEFGFESMPSMRTIKYFSAPERRNLFSEVMESHQGNKLGNSKLVYYMSQYYPLPKTTESIAYTSQLVHSYAMRTAVEHLRKNSDICHGALYWQLNDCWPAISFSAIDSLGEYKALYYASREFFAPILLCADNKHNTVEFTVCNQARERFDGYMEYSLKTNDFEVIKSERIYCDCAANSSRAACTEDFSVQINSRKNKCFLEYCLYSRDGKLISKNTLTFVRPKHYAYEKPKLEYRLAQNGDDIVIEVSASKYADKVFIDVEDAERLTFSKQYFAITSNKKEYIRISGVKDINILKKIKLLSVYDIDCD